MTVTDDAASSSSKATEQWVYLDHNATTPLHPDALAAMCEAERRAWANPASVHRPGQVARAELESARRAVAALVGKHPRDVTLTSGGTEANNLALWQPFLADPCVGTLLVSRLEHPSVVRAAERLARAGVEVRWLAVGAAGVVSAAAVSAALQGAGGPILVALQAVNHETGVVQPVAAVADVVHRAGAMLHVDAVQAVGKVPRCWQGADTVAVAAHKFYGPKGIGALVTAPSMKLRPLLGGGEQERGGRPGTQSAALAAGMAVAAKRALSGPERYLALAPLRDALERGLMAIAAACGLTVVRNGDAGRAPHVSNLSWVGWSAPELCAALDLERVAVSSGSACAAGTAEPSPVITAMVGAERARGAVRVSLGENTSRQDVARALAAWRRVVAR